MAEPVSSNAAEDDPERSEYHDGAAEETKGGAHRKRGKGKAKKKRPFWVELPILIVVALALTFVIQQFFFRVYMIPSGSMETTLHGCEGCTGDRILVDKITYDFVDPTPGDVVVFKGPDPWVENEALPEESSNPVGRFFRSIGSVFGLAPPDERDFVKRIIAMPGQTVECCDTQNHVVVDGKALDEPYLHFEDGTGVQAPFEPVKVPLGSVWVMGDNRNNSSDSRMQGGGGERGAVPLENIIGKARIIVLPPGRWGGVTDHNPQEAAQPAVLGMSAPAWQQGIPLGIGVVAAWPTVWAGRKLGTGLRGAATRKR
ncbi:signal peptidase I [Amycolatopsis magusensis]|uniref:Signal peptidase I n=1 Tax=Amycolatopsis magusensis TaxID=882444 RepID=A0ABS4Q5Q3_9PSEU|nr:signal peptidase I [Amycolatopsis magusensis]MBP2186429.1 signal peptidase I [Amycolatopsis magusensis]MDI5976013.1 signal peptidase I [Amycolatopsis magusensis]